jgi:flagellar basal-body rod protein FlgC
MDISSLFDISAAGMNVERMRLEVSAANLANANTTRGPNGIPYVPQQVVVQSGAARFDQTFEAIRGTLPALPEARVEASPVAPRLVYDPAHPDANADGFVSYPGVDPVSEMVQLMTVTRAYEADVRAFNAARSMAQRALDIGSSR